MQGSLTDYIVENVTITYRHKTGLQLRILKLCQCEARLDNARATW